MVDETKVGELRGGLAKGVFFADCACDGIPHKDLFDTLEVLWKIARAAKRWKVAAPGRESSEREAELSEFLEELPPA